MAFGDKYIWPHFKDVVIEAYRSKYLSEGHPTNNWIQLNCRMCVFKLQNRAESEFEIISFQS